MTTRRNLLQRIDKEVSKFTPQEISEMPTLNVMIDTYDDINDINNINSFLDRVKDVDTLFKTLDENIIQISVVYDQLKVSYKHEDTQRHFKTIDELIKLINTTAKTVREKIKNIDNENKNIKNIAKEEKKITDSEKKITDSDIRIREAQHNRLNKKFVNLMINYNNVVKENNNKYLETLNKSRKLVDPNVSDLDSESTRNPDELSSLANSIYSGRSLESSEQDLQYINDRHNDIIKLEKSLEELYGMFLDMAVIVESQNETIDSIVHSTEAAHHYIIKSHENVKEAEELQTSSRRKKICICGWTLFIIGIIVLIVILTI